MVHAEFSKIITKTPAILKRYGLRKGYIRRKLCRTDVGGS
jgi:hypothetical protein